MQTYVHQAVSQLEKYTNWLHMKLYLAIDNGIRYDKNLNSFYHNSESNNQCFQNSLMALTATGELLNTCSSLTINY